MIKRLLEYSSGYLKPFERTTFVLNDQFKRNLLGENPAKALEAIQQISNEKLSLYTAASTLRQFIEKPDFHKGRYEHLLRKFPDSEHPDKYINYHGFFDASVPFEASTHYLKLTSLGLNTLLNKADAPDGEILSLSGVDQIRSSIRASSELVAATLSNDYSGADEKSLLQKCLFGQIWFRYFNFFEIPESRGELLDSMQDGMLAVYLYGSNIDQQVIQSIQQI